MPTFRKKPVEIEARQYDGRVIINHPVARWVRENGGEYFWAPGDPQRLVIETLEGGLTVSPGDWVIRGVQGEFYPCKPDIFAATYEEVSGELSPQVGHDAARDPRPARDSRAGSGVDEGLRPRRRSQ